MSRNDLEEPETWAVRTFGQAELGDLRRTDRLVQLAAALARNPHSSLPASLHAEAETVGAYRFLNRAALTPEQILMPHFVQTRREAATRSQVLMIGDTTECNLSSHHSVKGAGPVGRGSVAQGFFIHSVLQGSNGSLCVIHNPHRLTTLGTLGTLSTQQLLRRRGRTTGFSCHRVPLSRGNERPFLSMNAVVNGCSAVTLLCYSPG